MEQQTNEHAAWRKLLAPLVSTLTALAGSYVIVEKGPHSSDTDRRLREIENRQYVVETKIAGIDDLKVEVRGLSQNINRLIGKVELMTLPERR